jgi:hypothetical protein
MSMAEPIDGIGLGTVETKSAGNNDRYKALLGSYGIQ